MVAANDHIGDNSLIWKSFIWQPLFFWNTKNEELRTGSLWIDKIDIPKSIP